MKARKTVQKKARSTYSPELKQQALERAERDGVATAARDLGLKEPSSMPGDKRPAASQTTEDQKLEQAELGRLKRENAKLSQEVELLKKRRRTLPRSRREVRRDRHTGSRLSGADDVPAAGCVV